MSEQLQELEWFIYVAHLAELIVAFVLAIPIGWDREKESRSMGLRTFPLVAVASCGYMLVGQSVVGDDPDALSRVIYGLMTGIGFIGGGAILKDNGSVRGTATAASIWNTGAVGAAVAFQRYEIAVALALVNFLILRFLEPLKGRVTRFQRICACGLVFLSNYTLEYRVELGHDQGQLESDER